MGMNKPNELNSLRVIVDVIDFERIILSAAMLALITIQLMNCVYFNVSVKNENEIFVYLHKIAQIKQHIYGIDE